jgi:glycosyltransferase involved in cell wall biosynthesis
MRRWFPRATVLFDCRAASPAAMREALEHLGTVRSARAREAISQCENAEREAATGADHILCLSAPMAQYLTGKYALPFHKVTVVPCCVDCSAWVNASRDRSAVRRDLRLDGRLVVSYCGELEWYQLPEFSLRVFEACRLRHVDAHFLAITTSPEKMRRFCINARLEESSYTIVRVQPELVPHYLAAADVGLLSRASGLDSRVSSPIKFGEYLASGVPVIASDGIGDVSDLIRQEQLGLVLPSAALDRNVPALANLVGPFLDAYRRAPATWRARCQHVARTRLDWAVHLPKVRAIYQRLNACE